MCFLTLDKVSALLDPRSPCAEVRLLTPAEVFPILAELRPGIRDIDCEYRSHRYADQSTPLYL